ncbi:MAG TPA: DUF503 domain-containing protein [Myxococcota bacterium]|nr:DUF503 domain-containing protein [Myxococcota bacterium]
MVVGVMELALALYDNESLKDKRSVVKRVIGRVRQTFNVSAAEVDDLDFSDRATIGIVAVGNDRRYIMGMLDKIEGFVDRMAIADILDATKTLENY